MTFVRVEHLGETGRVDKVVSRRLALAESAMKTIGELGYARSSLREIAANSELSHGAVHYYFEDKIELVAFCVRVYKTACSQRYDEIVESATVAAELLEGVLREMAATLKRELSLHRLWYDIRSQSMFEPRLRQDVEMIDDLLRHMVWRIVTRYGELEGTAVSVDADTAYAVVDGLFSQAVLRSDTANACEELTARVRVALQLLLLR